MYTNLDRMIFEHNTTSKKKKKKKEKIRKNMTRDEETHRIKMQFFFKTEEGRKKKSW